MSQERSRRRSSIAEEFDTSLMYDDIEKIREREEEEEKDQNGKIGSAGLMALAAGIGFFITGLVGGGSGLVEFLNFALPTIGFGALGYGMFKGLSLVFRQKELNFPALNVYRKTRPQPASAARERERETKRETNSNERSRDFAFGRTEYRRTRAYQRDERKSLRRSRTNRVFSGVAGGLADYMGISAALIRFAFIAALFIGWGMPIFIYLLFSIVLPANYDDYEESKSRSRPSGNFS